MGLVASATTKHHCAINQAPSPRHWTDTKLYKTWPANAQEIVTYGHFRLKWEATESGPTIDRWGYQRLEKTTKVTKYYSKDGAPWEKDVYTVGYSWGTPRVDSGVSQELEDAICLGKKRKQQARTTMLARERRGKLKVAAAEKGISFKEHTEQVKVLKKARNLHNVTKKDVERTTRLIAIGPTLRDLKNEVDHLLRKMEKTPKELNLTYISRGKDRLQVAVRLLQEWGR